MVISSHNQVVHYPNDLLENAVKSSQRAHEESSRFVLMAFKRRLLTITITETKRYLTLHVVWDISSCDLLAQRRVITVENAKRNTGHDKQSNETTCGIWHMLSSGRGGGGWRRVLPYISHIGMCPPPPKGMVCAPFWSENGYRLCPFWSGIGYGFRGNYGNVWTYLSFQFQMNKEERNLSSLVF